MMKCLDVGYVWLVYRGKDIQLKKNKKNNPSGVGEAAVRKLHLCACVLVVRKGVENCAEGSSTEGNRIVPRI